MNYEGAFAYMLVPKRMRTRSKGIAAWQARATPPHAMTVYLDAR